MQINALSIIIIIIIKESTSKGTTCKLNYHDVVDFIHVYFCEAMDSMQFRPPNANQEVSKTNHFGVVSDSLGRLAAASEYSGSSYCNLHVTVKIHLSQSM